MVRQRGWVSGIVQSPPVRHAAAACLSIRRQLYRFTAGELGLSESFGGRPVQVDRPAAAPTNTYLPPRRIRHRENSAIEFVSRETVTNNDTWALGNSI